MILKAARFIWDSLFPVRCPSCGKFAPPDKMWCDKCLKNTLKVRRLPIYNAGLTECVALTLYQGAVKELLHELKFGGKKARAAYLTNLLRYFPEEILQEDMIVVPVPLSKERMKERGYNQTAEIFSVWAEKKHLRWRDLLARVKKTQPQYRLNKNERAQNVRDAFKVKENFSVQGAKILLADDIYTSGATLAECARILKMRGAREVSAVVIASDFQKK